MKHHYLIFRIKKQSVAIRVEVPTDAPKDKVDRLIDHYMNYYCLVLGLG